MKTTLIEKSQSIRHKIVGGTAFSVLIALSFTHLLNDTLQSVIPAIYPLIKDSLKLNFTQIGLITLAFQLSSSIFQPVIGWYTDKKPQPYSLPIGMTFSMFGIFFLSMSTELWQVLVSVVFCGIGSSIFHPEASRLAHLASGGKHGTAQALFQVGGNLGGSLGPLMAALIVAPFGQQQVRWFCLLALLCILVMFKISKWYKHNLYKLKNKSESTHVHHNTNLSKNKVIVSLIILLLLIISKYFYMASFSSYYTFYLIHKFNVSTQDSQLLLFIFSFSVAAGTLIGGPIGDKIGRKYVIWVSILGVAPFTLIMPYANLMWTCILSVPIGFILASAFSAILVYAQELFPGKVGTISGLFFGFAFGMGGIGSALLGKLADQTSIEFVYKICSFLPLLGLITAFLPNLKKKV